MARGNDRKPFRVDRKHSNTHFMKKVKIMLPVLAFVFAIGSAFALKSETEVTTYKNVSGATPPCQQEFTCDHDSNTNLCSDQTYYNASNCSTSVTRYRP